jgi:multidrug efflux pump
VITRFIDIGAPEGFWWVQFSTAIISGLGFSTLLTLIIIPVMITLPERMPSFKQAALKRIMFWKQTQNV